MGIEQMVKGAVNQTVNGMVPEPLQDVAKGSGNFLWRAITSPFQTIKNAFRGLMSGIMPGAILTAGIFGVERFLPDLNKKRLEVTGGPEAVERAKARYADGGDVGMLADAAKIGFGTSMTYHMLEGVTDSRVVAGLLTMAGVTSVAMGAVHVPGISDDAPRPNPTLPAGSRVMTKAPGNSPSSS